MTHIARHPHGHSSPEWPYHIHAPGTLPRVNKVAAVLGTLTGRFTSDTALAEAASGLLCSAGFEVTTPGPGRFRRRRVDLVVPGGVAVVCCTSRSVGVAVRRCRAHARRVTVGGVVLLVTTSRHVHVPDRFGVVRVRVVPVSQWPLGSMPPGVDRRECGDGL